MQTLPNFLIVGAARCGTTSFTEYLKAHPQVFMSEVKELEFFLRNSKFHRGPDWYAAHFEAAGDAPAIGEATPAYMYQESAVTRMAALLPKAKLIVMLRDPVDRAYSHYWFNRARDREQLSFVDALAAEATRSPVRRSAYVGRGRYIVQLERLCRYYPRDRIHVILFDDFRNDLPATYAEVLRYLEVDDSVRPQILGEPANPPRMPRSFFVNRVARRLPHSVGRPLMRLNSHDKAYPPLEPAQRAALAARFADDNARLAEWLGRDLSAWST